MNETDRKCTLVVALASMWALQDRSDGVIFDVVELSVIVNIGLRLLDKSFSKHHELLLKFPRVGRQ